MDDITIFKIKIEYGRTFINSTEHGHGVSACVYLGVQSYLHGDGEIVCANLINA